MMLTAAWKLVPVMWLRMMASPRTLPHDEGSFASSNTPLLSFTCNGQLQSTSQGACSYSSTCSTVDSFSDAPAQQDPQSHE